MTEEATTTPPTVPSPTVSPPKPGWKTTEFYLKLVAMLLTALFASGAIPTTGTAATLTAIAATMLGALGYTVSRTLVKQAGVAMLAILAIGALTTSACTWLSTESKQVAHDIIDCTTSSAKDASKQFGPIVDALLAQATDDGGKVNWSPVKDLTKNFGAELGGCVLADTVARALKPAPADPNAPKASPLELDPVSLRAGFNAIRTEQLGGATFKTADGVL